MGQRGALADATVHEFPGSSTNTKTAPSPRAVRGIPKPAAWVPESGRKAWAAFAAELDRLHLVGVTLDRDFATLYADTYAKWEKVAKALNAEKKLAVPGDRDPESKKRHPLFSTYRELSGQLLALQTQAGLTPNSRLRMKAPEVGDEDPSRSVLS